MNVATVLVHVLHTIWQLESVRRSGYCNPVTVNYNLAIYIAYVTQFILNLQHYSTLYQFIWSYLQ